jgi:hypothetical protein
MKRIPLLIALVLIFSFGLTFGQAAIHVNTVGLYNNGGTPSVGIDKPVTFEISYENNLPGDTLWVAGSTNGFQVYGPDVFQTVVATWADISDAGHTGWDTEYDVPVTPINIFKNFFDGVKSITHRSCDGLGADTVTLATSINYYLGFPPGYNDNVMDINTMVSNLDDTLNQLCIDSAFWPPSGTWMWAPGGVPAWNGPLCYDIFVIPHLPPDMTDCPADYSGDHCTGVTEQFEMVVYWNDGDQASNPRFATTVGNITTDVINYGVADTDGNGFGTFTFTPSLADVGAPVVVTVSSLDDTGPGMGAPCTYSMNFTNVGPTFVGCPTEIINVGMGNCKTVTLVVDDVDCDPTTMSLVGPDVEPDGTYGFDAGTGVFTFCPTSVDGELNFIFEFNATDGIVEDDASCFVEFTVLSESGFRVMIEKTHNTLQGQHQMVDVTFKGTDTLFGFDILIAYDASALTLANVVAGDVFTECGWEYFTFRFGPNGNCDGGCPSGLVRVVGIAETNNGPNHPNTDCIANGTLFTLDFLVSDDRTLECMYTPVRFFWLDCGDNSLAYTDWVNEECYYGMMLQGISRDVYEFEAYYYDSLLTPDESIDNANVGFPTYLGAQAPCYLGTGDYMDCATAPNGTILKPGPQSWVDFVNGGIDIVCADSIDARGDINLNNQAYEIADAVLFSNYFIQGLGVFVVNAAGQIAASDTNADGMALSVADLVYLIRVVVGDALPYAKLNPVGASYIADNGFVTVDQAMGAAYVVVAGNATPTLLAENMDMQYAFDGTNTRILVSSMEANQTFSGQFISVNGQVISVELATYEGAPVVAKQLPSAYELAQNYPNPFNPATNIAFSLKQAGDYSLTIYNVTGQTVEVFAGSAEAGTHNISWDASNQASGIYFYKLSTDNFTDTKKMVLLK